MARALNAMTAIETAHEPSVRPAQILLVEDNDADVFLFKETLNGLRLANNLSIASDGEQALSMLRREGIYTDQARPDLILLDLNLPRVDGREVLGAVKHDPTLSDIPVIVLTGSRALRDIEESNGLMADGYILKPIASDILRKLVASIESPGPAMAIPPDAEDAHGG